MKQKPERWIALSVMASSLLIIAVLSVVLGHWQPMKAERAVRVRFDSIAGVSQNTPVRFAGAPAGRVSAVRVLPMSERRQADGRVCFVEIVLDVPKAVELGQDVRIEIKQDGMLGLKYIALMPGLPEATPLENGAVLVGESAVELMDLAAPAQRFLTGLEPVLEEIRPMMKNLNLLSGHMSETLPEMMKRMDHVLGTGDELLQDIASPENRQKFDAMLRDMRVVSSNLKVVTTHSKALTATLGEKPWRLLWGGEPNVLTSEAEILASDKPLPARKVVKP